MEGLVSARPSAPRPYCRGFVLFAAVFALLAFDGLGAPSRAPAQELQFPQRPPPPKKSKIALEREKSGQKQMLVQANEINYDYTNSRVAAVGNVQIYYGGSTLEANRVVYDQKTKRLHAEGNVRLTEEDGKVTYGEIMDLSDNYRDGFVDSLRLDAPDQTRMAAARAERSGFDLPRVPPGRADFFLHEAFANELRAAAARKSSLNAVASTLSPSWMSIARRVLPCKLELKRCLGSGTAAPWANVSFTTF